MSDKKQDSRRVLFGSLPKTARPSGFAATRVIKEKRMDLRVRGFKHLTLVLSLESTYLVKNVFLIISI